MFTLSFVGVEGLSTTEETSGAFESYFTLIVSVDLLPASSYALKV